MKQPEPDCTRLLLEQDLRMLANELAGLARCLHGECRREVEALCSTARQMILAVDRDS